MSDKFSSEVISAELQRLVEASEVVYASALDTRLNEIRDERLAKILESESEPDEDEDEDDGEDDDGEDDDGEGEDDEVNKSGDDDLGKKPEDCKITEKKKGKKGE